MKRALFVLTVIAASAALIGCRATDCLTGSCAKAPENRAGGGEACGEACGDPSNCESAGLSGLGRDPDCRAGRMRRSDTAAGPPTGTITYPYYTVRAPRDFLAPNPPSIGP